MNKCKEFTSENCQACSLASFCINALPSSMRAQINRLVRQHITLDKLQSFTPKTGQFLYAVKKGIVKSHAVTVDGKERIQNYFLRGEVLGFDAMHASQYHNQITALKPSILCEIPLQQMLEVIKTEPTLQYQLLKIISRQMAGSQYLNYLSAEAKVMGFLLDFANKVNATVFRIPLTREDIGNYLGLASETITRTLTKLQDQGLIEINAKQVKLLDAAKLEKLLSSEN